MKEQLDILITVFLNVKSVGQFGRSIGIKARQVVVGIVRGSQTDCFDYTPSMNVCSYMLQHSV